MVKRGLVIFYLCSFLISAWSVEVGEEAPRFANPDFNNKFFMSKDVIGKNWVIVSFFATYCEGCKKEIPELEDLFQELCQQELAVSFLIMATDPEGAELVKPYFNKHPTNLTVLLDRFKTTTKKYDVKDLPTLFLIDPTGKVVFKIDKYSPETVKQVRQIILAKSSKQERAAQAKDKASTKTTDAQ